MRKLLNVLVWGALCAAPFAAAPAARAEQSAVGGKVLDVAVGTQENILLKAPAYRVAVGDPKIAMATPLRRTMGSELLVTGVAPGVTSLMVWEQGNPSPQVWRVQVNTAAPAAGPGEPKAQGAGGAVVLSGTATDQVSHEAAVQAAQLAAGKEGKVIDQSVIPVDDEVQVDVKVVEFSKTILKEVGINIFSSTNGFTLGTFAPNTLTKVSYPTAGSGALAVAGVTPIAQAFNLLGGVGNNGLSSYISMMESNGLLRVLAQPTLVAMNGQTASFLAGGEIPIPVPQVSGAGANTITIEYKKYGVSLDLTPTILSAKRIALKVAPSVSQLDYQHAIQLQGYLVPALLARQADTTVTLGNGESLVIGGLVDRQMTQDISRVPLLGDLPILGAFFRSVSYKNTDQELVIIVTPHLVRPIAAGAKLPPLPGAELDKSHFSLGKALLLPGSNGRVPNGPGYSE